MIADVVRSCYTRQCNFYTAGGPTGRIIWYRAPQGALPLPIESSFMSLNWSMYPFEFTGVGEVYTGPPKWSNGRTPPTATGKSYFGDPNYFLAGQPWNPNGPIVPRDPWGLAVQCSGWEGTDAGFAGADVGVSAEAD